MKQLADDDSESDEELMIRFSNGDASSICPLLCRYQAPLHGYLSRMLNGDVEAAEDGVQETFLKLLNQKSYQAGFPVRPWLYRIATNVAIDRLRRPQPLRLRPNYQSEDPAATPLETVEQGEQASRVRRIIQSLPQESRTVLILRYYQELSLQEISVALGVPVGTVKSRLFTAARRFREGIGAEVES